MVIELGGGIELRGFDNIDGGELVVVKKIVGQYARELNDNVDAYEALLVERSGEDEETVRATVNGSTTCSASHANLFIALDTALQSVVDDVIAQ
jgi:hypothetical protein